MATNQVNINLQVVNRSEQPVTSAPAWVYNQDLSNPFSPTQGSVVQSGTTDGNGRVLFTGIGAGTYDLGVEYSGNTRILRGYVVKNEYTVSPGTTSFDYESKSFVVDQTSTLSPGILGKTVGVTGVYALNGRETIYRSLFPGTGTGFNVAQTVTESKVSGTSNYHTTSSLLFSQNAKMKIG